MVLASPGDGRMNCLLCTYHRDISLQVNGTFNVRLNRMMGVDYRGGQTGS